MNESETGQSITLEMPFEEFFPLFISTYLSEKKLGAYIGQHHTSFDYPTLLEFFQREPMKQLFETQWDFERNPRRFPNYTIQTVMKETVIHTLSNVEGLVTMHTHGVKTIFENQSMEQDRLVQKIIFFYKGYFSQEFFGEYPNMVP
jgi:hypothetical protein